MDGQISGRVQGDGRMPAGCCKPAFSADRLSRITTMFRDDVAANIIPGAVVLIAHNGTIQYHECFGYRDRANSLPMTTDSLFTLASLTKPVVSVAALMLVERGKIQLGQPLSRFLPGFKNMRVGVERTDAVTGARTLSLEPAAREATIQDLLRHTSGFTYGEFGDSLVQKAYIEAGVSDFSQTNAELIGKLAALPLAYQPGTTFEYGMSTDVLGHIVEIVSGMTLDRYIAENIAGPLGMTNTRFTIAGDATDRVALADPVAASSPAAVLGRLAPPLNSTWLSGGGGLYSTASDYFRFCQMLLNGGHLDGVRLLSPKTIEWMTKDHLPPEIRYGTYMTSLQAMAPTAEMGQGFGLGVVVRTMPGRNPWPGSIGDFYWAGVSGAYFWVDPQEQLVAVLMLRAPGERVHYRGLMRQLVYQALL